ncbi:MAG: hypothetical protein NAG76_01750 [Candidatus Pristimantibacillus lignocellulolyticus]|uniref:Uncharacterized protein n=1 Tax=Candidatus Pristimantibacillus lignocellulolyticus TaxID=2994561 RepID=A0A9J6ZFQ8_9BACL|nr:MAG: hypothetical protein NAG76_01750 [Candidatus Pristimantibacillus lignocellulolyticus]
MKVILLISYLIVSIVSPIQLNNVTPIAEAATVDLAEQSNILVNKQPQEIITLHSVNGISLYDDTSTVIEKLGAPKQISIDPYFVEYEMYEYANMTISFIDDIVDSVEVKNGASSVMLDQVELPITIAELKLALGEPDYVADDGLVFQRDEAILKLFIDQENDQLQSIAFYHIAST